jgi:hypothetical protein
MMRFPIGMSNEPAPAPSDFIRDIVKADLAAGSDAAVSY